MIELRLSGIEIILTLMVPYVIFVRKPDILKVDVGKNFLV